jgi:two-component system OmpR family response regulator
MTKTTLPPKTRKILIVEDEGEMCLLLNILLDAKEMELDHVKFLSNAVEYLEKEQPAVVLLDNKLPDGYGVDFISYIKKNYPGIKVIMISGFDSSAKDVAMANGADDYIEKPFTRNQLFDSITRLVN